MTGFVYAARSSGGGPIKFGFSRDPERRVAKLCSVVAGKVVLIASHPGSRHDEKAIHWALAPFGLGGEWFEDHPSVLLMIDRVARGDLPALGAPPPRHLRFGTPEESDFIAKARRALGMSQKELAEAIGLSQSSISRFETGADALDRRTALVVWMLLKERKATMQIEMPLYPRAPGYKRAGTAEEAAAKMAPKAPKLRERVLSSLERAAEKGLTADECAEALGVDMLSIRPRLSELRAEALVSDSGLRRPNAKGNNQIVWRKA